MNTSGTFAYLVWPLVVIGGFSAMVLALRWTFSRGHSLVERRPQQGLATEYGLLVAVSSPGNYIEGEQLRLLLLDSGIRATLVTTLEGPRLMVFEGEASLARAILLNPPAS